MPTRKELVSRLCDPGLIAILRASNTEGMPEACAVLLEAGLSACEVTLTTQGALKFLREAKAKIPQLVLGCGSVLTVDHCRQAIAAGADFIVTPISRMEVIQEAHRSDRPVILGAFTPTEAQTAHEAGADLIKIFPADSVGPAYIRALLAPLPHLRLVPTGGVDQANVRAFFEAGGVAVGVGSSLVSPSILKEAKWSELTRRAKSLLLARHAAEEV